MANPRFDLFLTHLVQHQADYVLLAAGRTMAMVKDGVESPLVEASGDQILSEHVQALLSEITDIATMQSLVEGMAVAFPYASPWGMFRIEASTVNGMVTARATPSGVLDATAGQSVAVAPLPPSGAAAPAPVRQEPALASTMRAAEGRALPTSAMAPRQGVAPVVPGGRIDEMLRELFDRQGEHLIMEAGAPFFLVHRDRPKKLSSARDLPVTNEDIVALLLPITGERGQSRLSEGQATSYDYASPHGDVLVEFKPQGGRFVARLTPLRLARERSVAGTPIPSMISDIESFPDGRPGIERWFDLLVDMKGSDLHLTAGLCPVVRVHGQIVPLPQLGVPTVSQLEAMLRAIMPPGNLEEFDACNDTDFAYATRKARLRCNVFRDRHGIAAVFRVIPNRTPTAGELNLPPVILEMCSLNKGLVLVTGPTGSGKSTTLAAMIDWINENRSGHLLTLEDPIEFTHDQKRCLVRQRQVGMHTNTFARALRAALREDPDFILVGELRDLETSAMAIETAETGHLVFATLHTNTAASAVDRLIDQFPADREAQIRLMLSETLRGVVAQTLCQRKEGGRVAALEILKVTQGVRSMIRERKTFQIESVMQTGKSHGMQTLNDALLNLVRAGTITADEAYLRAVDRGSIKPHLLPLGLNPEHEPPS